MEDDSIEASGFQAILGEISRTPLSARTILSRLNHERDELWQFRLYLDLGEVYIKIVAAWLLNRVRLEPLNRDSDVLRRLIENLRTPTSLGNWQGVIQDTSKLEIGDFERGLAGSISPAIKGIVKIRNEDAHCATPSRSEISQKLKTLNNHVEELVERVTKSELFFECIPVRQSAHLSPVWARFIVSHGSTIRTDLFPWIVAGYAKDDPSALFVYDKRNDKKIPLYVDLAASEPPSNFPPDPQQIITDEFRAIFDVGAAPVFFDSLIEARSGLSNTDSSYIQRTPLVNRILDSAATERGKVLFLRGDAGSGKTSLCCQIINQFRLEAGLTSQFLVLHHFCGRESSILDSSKRVLDNLAAQLLHADMGAKGQSFAVLAKEALALPGRKIRIIIDGLDEVEDSARRALLEVIRDLVDLGADTELQVILAGQPKIEGDLRAVLKNASNTISVDGFTLEDVRVLANKLELWNAGWTDADSLRLLKQTSGLALYVDSFLRDVASGDVRRELISNLPSELTGYWEQSLQRSIHSILPAEALNEKQRETQRLLGQVHSKYPDLLSRDLMQELCTAASDVIRSHHSGDERMIPLYVIANFPRPLSLEELREVLGWADTKLVKRALAPFGSLVLIERDHYRLYHRSVATFLWSRLDSAHLLERADRLVLAWLANWRADENRPHLWFEFFDGWNRRLLSPGTGNSQAIEAFLARFNNLDWMEWVVVNRRTSALFALSLSLLEDTAFAELSMSFALRPEAHRSSESVVRDMIAHIQWCKELDEERQGKRQNEYVDEQDREPLEELGGFSRRDMADWWESSNASEMAEQERLNSKMPESWFTGSFDTSEALREIRAAYNAVLEDFEIPTEHLGSRAVLSRISEFLSSRQAAFAEIANLDPTDQRIAIANVIVSASGLASLSVTDEALSLLASRTPQFKVVAEKERIPRHGEVVCRPIRGGLFFATRAPCLAIREDNGTSKSPQTSLALYDWLRDHEVNRIQFPEGSKVVVHALRDDAAEILLSIDGTYHVMKWDQSSRKMELLGDSDFKAATSDLRFITIFHDKSYRVFDATEGVFVEPDCSGVSEPNGMRLADDGKLGTILDYRSFRFWSCVPANVSLWWCRGFNPPENEKKPRNFILSPNGRFFYLRGEIREVSTGFVWRKLEHVDWDAQAIFSADGRMLAILQSGGQLEVFDVQTGACIAEIACRSGSVSFYNSSNIAFSPDGRFLFAKTISEAFSVVDLRRSGIRAPALRLQDDLELIPVAPSLGQIVSAALDSGHLSVISLADGSASKIGQKEILAAAISHDEVEFWEDHPVSCVGVKSNWSAFPGFILRELDKTSLAIVSTTEFLDPIHRLDWEQLSKYPTFLQSDDDPPDLERIASKGWGVVCFVPGFDDEIIAHAYPNILLLIDLSRKRVLSVRNTGDFEFEGDKCSISDDTIAFCSYVGRRCGLWNFREDRWTDVAIDVGPNANMAGSITPVLFPWLNEVALVCDWRGVIGHWGYTDSELTLYERDEYFPAANHSAFALEGTSFMLAVTKSSGVDYALTSGVFILNPFTGESFGHRYFEKPIRTLIQLEPNRFCVLFTDGTFELIRVEQQNKNSADRRS